MDAKLPIATFTQLVVGVAEFNLPTPGIWCRDNLDVLQGINSESVDLVYLDPPFNKGKNFHAPIGSSAEGASFDDIWSEDSVKQEQHDELRYTHPDLYQYIESVAGISSDSAKWYLSFMTVRLIEIHRILKPSGSVFLHCDPTASHYLKLVLDAIWGHKRFANEIIWAYRGAGNASRRFMQKHDVILFYQKDSKKATFMPQYTEMTEETKAAYNKVDKDGRRYYRRIVDGVEKRTYLDESKGRPVLDWWDDIPSFQSASNSKERLGYPTQKPLKLLERVILSTTEVGDIVLDPFCGCATTCVAAHLQNREWLGIDVSVKAYELVKQRLKRQANQGSLEVDLKSIDFQTGVPKRTDNIPELPGAIDPLPENSQE